MPIKMEPPTAQGMNMTPMIDIVFNLVQFFMLTLDMSRKELAALDLPRAHEGIEDKDPNANRMPGQQEDHTRFVINLTADGNIAFKGETYRLSGAPPVEQAKSLEALKKKLRELTRDHVDPRTGVKLNLHDSDGASKVMVLVRGDRTTKWQYVQWVMQVCADPTIKIYKIHFGVEHPKAAAPGPSGGP